MKNFKQSCALISLSYVLLSLNANATPAWQCMAFSTAYKSYTGAAQTRTQAMHKAKNRCQKHQKNHTLCKTAQSYCHQQTTAMQQKISCLVSDQKDRLFSSNSCKNAMLACQQWQFKHGLAHSGGCIVNHKRR